MEPKRPPPATRIAIYTQPRTCQNAPKSKPRQLLVGPGILFCPTIEDRLRSRITSFEADKVVKTSSIDTITATFPNFVSPN
ncbi:hypothetical protein KIN20_031632 [Parelaphostrongylus tenuis]|uniref:Uncharacterized protein n=1 Tax=Parelaphostrongylus tenuis TaxID=148309 RepID=A0AAD5R731_PARTN|nr:hypothetical protein KIN20_031632 [Parelaphostrongylus tenuis]